MSTSSKCLGDLKRDLWNSKTDLGIYEERMGAFARAVDCAVAVDMLGTSPATILDVPCGTGRFARVFRKLGHTVQCVDYSREMCRYMRERYGSDPFRVIRADVFSLPFAEHTFDVVFTSRLAFHYENLVDLLPELARVVKPSGFIIFDSLNRYSLRHMASVLIDRFRSPGQRLWFHSLADVRLALKKAGLQVIESRSRYVLPTRAYRYVPHPLLRPLRWLEHVWPRQARVVTFWKVGTG